MVSLQRSTIRAGQSTQLSDHLKRFERHLDATLTFHNHREFGIESMLKKHKSASYD
jgi:hypothetical protein